MSPPLSPLIDRFGRRHTSLRISVTDRCNIRCFYCMPETDVVFQKREELLTFEEITRVTEIACRMGVNKVRLTGGEPLVRQALPQLIEKLATIDSLQEIALTTNGILLAEHAENLKKSGLDRINISLDTLNETRFRQITRRDEFQRVMAGIDAAVAAKFEHIRLNALAISGITESELIPLVRFASDRNLEMRFIEFMPLDADQQWQNDQVLSGRKMIEILKAEWSDLRPAPRDTPSQPASNFHVPGTSIRVGLINSVTEPFCGQCNRLRLTAEGKIRNCLFSTEEWDIRTFLRDGSDDETIAQQFDVATRAKRAGHGSDNHEFVRPDRAMYQIGG
ncbi:MAG: GTP 3',8-cyclase MoaA [Planctomycetota bacterium]|nr:GTP 3',8-cyclase MoaA [Planctomycetota bacterium]